MDGLQLLFWCKLKTPGVGPNWMFQVAQARVGSSKDALKMSSEASPAAFPACTFVALGSASFIFVLADLFPGPNLTNLPTLSTTYRMNQITAASSPFC